MAVEETPEPRLMRVHDYFAEYLEKRAARMPEGPDRDRILRMAKLFRASGRREMARVWVPLDD